MALPSFSNGASISSSLLGSQPQRPCSYLTPFFLLKHTSRLLQNFAGFYFLKDFRDTSSPQSIKGKAFLWYILMNQLCSWKSRWTSFLAASALPQVTWGEKRWVSLCDLKEGIENPCSSYIPWTITATLNWEGMEQNSIPSQFKHLPTPSLFHLNYCSFLIYGCFLLLLSNMPLWKSFISSHHHDQDNS